MSAVFIVLLGVVLPFCLMFVGFVSMIKSRNDDTIKGMVIGIILAVCGGLMLFAVSIILVHELTLYAPYFLKK